MGLLGVPCIKTKFPDKKKNAHKYNNLEQAG